MRESLTPCMHSNIEWKPSILLNQITKVDLELLGNTLERTDVPQCRARYLVHARIDPLPSLSTGNGEEILKPFINARHKFMPAGNFGNRTNVKYDMQTMIWRAWITISYNYSHAVALAVGSMGIKSLGLEAWREDHSWSFRQLGKSPDALVTASPCTFHMGQHFRQNVTDRDWFWGNMEWRKRWSLSTHQ